MALVQIWPDKFARAWDGRADRSAFQQFPIVPVHEALSIEYNSDAHFCPAVIEGEEQHPRITVQAADSVRERVRFYVIVLDVDAPNHKATPDWLEEQRFALKDTPWDGAVYYATAGGYRLVWELPQALTIDQYLATLGALRAEVARYGVECDALKDWTRCYRLPFVNRAGKAQRHEFIASANPIFPLAMLNVAAQPQEASIGALVANATVPLTQGPVEEGNRNRAMFRMLAAMRNLSWLDADVAREMALVLNTAKFNPPLPETEVSMLVDNVWQRYQAPQTPDADVQEAIDKVRIELTKGHLDEHVDTIIEALAAHVNVFHRDGRLVRVMDTNCLDDFRAAGLRTVASEVAEFYTIKNTDDGPTTVRADPPKDVIECVLERGTYPKVRELQQVFSMPSLRPDGHLLTEEGYDAPTKSLLRPEFTVDVPDDPTMEEVHAARDRLLDLYQDFPFEEEIHRAAAIASMMTPVLRLAITGPTPMFIFESPTPSSGKSIMADLVAIVATGKGGTPMAPTNEEETTKQITSQLLLGAKVIWIDNVERPLGGPSLDAALTSDMWAARELGRNKMLHLKNAATWLATGNNIRLAGDLARRAIRIYINPNMENPEERDPSKFRYPDLRGYLKTNRSDIVRDILLLARARHKSGFVNPGHGIGSFESWSYWVRDTLMFAGLADCVETQNAYKKNQTLDTFGTFLYCAHAVFNKSKGVHTDAFCAKEIFNSLAEGARHFGTQADCDGLIAAFKELVDDVSMRSAADFLRRWSNRVVGGLKIEPMGSDRVRGKLYRIARTNLPKLAVVEENIS
jgi:hypothetical protein